MCDKLICNVSRSALVLYTEEHIDYIEYVYGDILIILNRFMVTY